MDADAALALGRAFDLPGRFAGVSRHGSGHIHDTFVAVYEAGDARLRFVHQRINTSVFHDPEQLMRNWVRVTGHLRRRLAQRGVADLERRHLQVVPARDGRPCHVDAEGRYWRTTRFVEGTRSVDALESPAQAREAARAFGAFAALLRDLEGPPLADTIPHFHDLARRFRSLEAAASADPVGRARGVAREIGGLRSRYADVIGELSRCGEPPRRVVHNDCKVNNLLLDQRSGEGLCVIDLDTVMEGTLLCDFGELVRTGTCPTAEDERDLERVRFDLERFDAIAGGYLEGFGPGLEASERRGLPVAGEALALENAIRFLTDHLEGDRYFRILRAGHNLERARAQLRLAERMAEQRDAARASLSRLLSRGASPANGPGRSPA
jgi:Ser/Thr protein kinase RdoA (MazF antagonist)